MLITLDHIPDQKVEIGNLLSTVVVSSANVVKDIRENLRNLVGGRMKHYEALIDKSVTSALAELEQKAREQGYDGVIGVKLSHPTVVDGGVEVVAYGNGFKYKTTNV